MLWCVLWTYSGWITVRTRNLAAGLKMHIHSLIERAKNQVVLEDIFLEEIKENYPLVFEMGACITGYLEEELGIANALAVPHAMRSYASRSTIAVARLVQPVKWGGFDVRLVMLFAINESDRRMIKIFFD